MHVRSTTTVLVSGELLHADPGETRDRTAQCRLTVHCPLLALTVAALTTTTSVTATQPRHAVTTLANWTGQQSP